ncbi:MAG: ATP-binding protein [Bacteroidales bacterium]|nr:ATP-binding protein [Bacteroidales bacterium]MDD4673568.1 ATP-binding protein [Bacteroidales bacterium]MDY0347824.1 ATP-binding protein [Tenuifilaceae bacterium]
MSSKRNKSKHGYIKPKVLFGFIIIMTIAAVALFVTYTGFIELTETRQNLSEPSKKLINLNSILTDIYEAESNIRTYTLTQNESYLSIYLSFMKNINIKVDSLLKLTHDNAVQAEKIRFIQELLSRKRRVLNELVVLKQSDQTSRFYQKAMEQVEMIDLDSIRESSVITSVTTTKTSRRDSVIKVKPEEGSQSGFSKLFGWLSKKESSDSVITKLIVEVETQIDTLSRSVMSPSDSLLNEVKSILSEIQTQQEMALYDISKKELEILKSDKEIMDQIRTIVSLLEREELMNSIELAQDVEAAVEKSTKLLLILGGVAIFMFILFTTLIFRDVTRATYYRNELLKSKQYAEKLLKVKQDFLANMNHEIRTPLSAIVGLSKQLKTKSDSNNKPFIIESLNKSSIHLLNIVNDILDLSKIEGGFIRLEKNPFKPNVIAADVVENLSIKAEEKNIAIRFESHGDDNVTVSGDSFRLSQILINLIGNAIKFTSNGYVKLSIHSTKTENSASFKFTVADTGIGIPADKIDNIFEEFNQVDSSTTRLYGGTGLGLSIVKKLVEIQNGTIAVSSQEGKGTTFTVKIGYPLATEQEAIASTADENFETPKLPNDLNIVVVDDDPISQMLVSEMLKTLGTKPKVYGDPFKAIGEIEENPPTVILTDIQMPMMSGIELVQRVRNLKLNQAPVIIALTANSTDGNQDYYIDKGFYCALTKPFNEISLYNAIAPVVGRGTVKNTGLSPNRIEGYDIAEIKRFADNDDQSTCKILQSFVDNSIANVKYLKGFVEEKNWKGVSEVSHRMKSAFRQLRVDGLGQLLEQLENINPHDVDETWLHNTIEEVLKEVKMVQALLNRDIENLSSKTAHEKV